MAQLFLYGKVPAIFLNSRKKRKSISRDKKVLIFTMPIKFEVCMMGFEPIIEIAIATLIRQTYLIIRFSK
jgi:hypothetical protein